MANIALPIWGQKPSDRTRSAQGLLKPIHRYKNAVLLDVSPNGKWMCIRLGKPGQTFVVSRGMSHEVPNGGHLASLVELNTGVASILTQPSSAALYGSFFQNSDSLYLVTAAVNKGDPDIELQVKIPGGEVKVLQRPSEKSVQQVACNYQALDDERLLCAEFNRATHRSEALSQAVLPEYKTSVRVSLERDVRENSWTTESAPIISADRKSLVCGLNSEVIYYSAAGLHQVWRRKVEAPLRPLRVAISASGARVAISALDTTYVEQQREFYVGILDGKDGSFLARLPINGFDGIAISPDGQTLAVSQLIEGTKRSAIPAVHLYNVASGKKLAILQHDPVNVDRAFLFGALTIQFTSNGKHIVTSGIDTLVWDLSQLQ